MGAWLKLVLILAVSSTGPLGAAAQTPERSGVLRNIASYIGLADFCAAHGVDFRPLASRMREGLTEHLSRGLEEERADFRYWDRMGQRAIIYNVQQGRAVNLVEHIRDFRQFCAAAQQHLTTISQIK